jgi:hypothetical protein
MRRWTKVLGNDTANDIFVDVHTERCGDNLSDSWAAKQRVAPFQLDDDLDEFRGWAFRAWLFSRSTRREQGPVLALDQVTVELEQGGRLHNHCDLGKAAGPKKQRAEPKHTPLHWCEIRGPLSRPTENEQLLLDEEILRHQPTHTARSEQPGKRSDKVD